MSDDPVARAWRFILININIDDPDAVCFAVLSTGQTWTGNSDKIDAAIAQIRQDRAAAGLSR